MSNINKPNKSAQPRLSGVFNPVFAGAYEKDSAILCAGKFYICVRDTIWLDKINSDWNEYTGQFIYHYEGTVETEADLPSTAINGTCLYVNKKGRTYAFNGTTWDPIEPSINLDLYAKKDDLLGYISLEKFDEEINKYVKKDELIPSLSQYPTKEELEYAISDFVANEELVSMLQNYPTNEKLKEELDAIDVTEQLKDYPTIEETKKMIDEQVDQIDVTEQLVDYAKKIDVETTLKDYSNTIETKQLIDEKIDDVEITYVNIDKNLIGSIITSPVKIENIDQLGYLEMNGGTYSQLLYPEFVLWCKTNAPSYLVNNNIVLPNWTARYLRNYGSINLNTTINGATVANTYNAGTPGTFSFDAMQRLNGEYTPYITDSYSTFSGVVNGVFKSRSQGGSGFASIIGYGVGNIGAIFDNALQARVDTENRPLSVAVVYYIKVKNVITGRDKIITKPEVDYEYTQGAFIIFRNRLYTNVRDTTWTGELTIDWQEYSGSFVYQFKGVKDKISELPDEVMNGTCFYVKEDKNTYCFNGKSWDIINPVIDTSEFIHYSEAEDLIQQSVRPTFRENHLYKKGDVIWVHPPTFDTITTPPTSEVTYPWTMPATNAYNLLGKPKTYQAQTTLKLFSISLRSTKDNNADNPLTNKGCIGTSWVVDEPHSVCEYGSSTEGDAVFYAGGVIDESSGVKTIPQVNTIWSIFNWTYPVKIVSNDKVSNTNFFGITFRGTGNGDGVCCFVQGVSSSSMFLTSRNFIDTNQRNVLTGVGSFRATWY